MFRRCGRITKVGLLSVLVLGLCSSMGLAQLTLSVSPTNATANSVWNFQAVWTNPRGIWPLGRPPSMVGGAFTEGHLDWGGPPSLNHTTIGQVRPVVAQDNATDVYWKPLLVEPKGFVGFNTLANPRTDEVCQGLGYVWVQPDPAAKIEREFFNETPANNDRGRYDCGLDYHVESISIPEVLDELIRPDEVAVMEPANGQIAVRVYDADGTTSHLVQRRLIREMAAGGNKVEALSERPATDAVVVPTYSPIWLVGVWGEPGHVPLRGEIKRAGNEAGTLYPRTGTLAGWPGVNVIWLPDKTPNTDQFSSISVAYYSAGTSYVLTQRSPLPMPYTSYQLSTATEGSTKIKFNPGILGLDIDKNKYDPTSWTLYNSATGAFGVPREGDPAQNIPGNPLLGVYDTTDLETATNAINYAVYFDRYTDMVAADNKLRIHLTSPLPAGTHDPDPDGVAPYSGDKVWVRFVQRATVSGNIATLENGNIIQIMRGIYKTPNLTGRNYYSSGFTKGNSTVTLSYPPNDPPPSVVWVDCSSQYLMTLEGSDNAVISDDAFSTIFADASDGDFAMFKVLSVTLDQAGGGTNYFVPYESQNSSHPSYCVWNLPLTKATVPKYHFKVRSYAVEKVTTDAAGTTANLSDRNSGGAYDAKLGLIRLNTTGSTLANPEPDASGAWTRGRQVYVFYAPLSRTTLTTGNACPGTIQTPTDSVKGLQAFTDPGVPPGLPNANYTYDTSGCTNVNDKLVLSVANTLPANTTSVQMDVNMFEPDQNGTGVVWVEGVPMYYVSGTPATGAVYRVATSAGLNMINPKQQPSLDWTQNNRDINNKLIYDPRGKPMWYTPRLRANDDGSPHTFDPDRVVAYAYYVEDGQLLTAMSSVVITVHDSTVWLGQPNLINYAGRSGTTGNRDWLTCAPDTFGASWPAGQDVDPLQIEPKATSMGWNATTPDDGSSSTQFVFRVRYNNQDGLPPLPWLHDSDDPWNAWSGGASGVVLYLDERGTGDYRPHFMQLERPDLEPGDADYAKYNGVYIYRIIPHNTIGIEGGPARWPFQSMAYDSLGSLYDNRLYQSLACGTYHYFFACSDDSLTFDGGSFPFENQSTNGQLEWGEVPPAYSTSYPLRNSTGLDPATARSVAGYEEINRPAKRRYSHDGGVTGFDQTLFVDRHIRVPGYFSDFYPEGSNPYPLPAEYHPRVTCALLMPSRDAQNLRYDDKKYGYGRFFGTLDPFYRASNPLLPGTRTGSNLANLAETSGATTKTDNVFRIMWKQIDGKPPISIKVFINNASERSDVVNNPADAAHTYTGYTMSPSPNQTQPYNYKTGVWYQYTTKLPAGPHTYYFAADDGEHKVMWPTRPDRYDYHAPKSTGSLFDWWVPTSSTWTEYGTPTYFDNDYVPGPYINHPCVLSGSSVTPGTGKEGDSFVYKVKYSDADGQRVYKAILHVKINDAGVERTFAMNPVVPILDPENDHSQQYKDGVEYYLDTGTVNDLSLEPGVRQYYFEFIDDWGRQGDVNDMVQGETTRLPAGDGNWFDGPVISSNRAPTLSKGDVQSQDGTANAGTTWTYRVTYRDLDNDKPSLIKVYIGLRQPDGKTIAWDDGHTMLEEDPSDNIYSDGKDFYFQTKLGGIDAVDPGQEKPEPKQYYYAFEAFDGLSWATYKSSSNDEERSNAAGCMILQNLVSSGDGIHYSFRPLLAQRAVSVTTSGAVTAVKPDNPNDIIKVYGVYLTEDLGAAADVAKAKSYYNPNLDTGVFKFGDSTIQVASGLAVSSTVNIKYVSVTKAVRTQTGTVTNATTVTPSDPTTILRVMSVTSQADPNTNYYRPFETIRLNVGSLPAGTSQAWVEYEAQSPLVGPLPVDLPPPAGVIPDAQIYENYSTFPYQILIDDQKNGWVSSIDSLDFGTMLMRGRCVSSGVASTQYVTPETPGSIASVEGIYKTSDFSGINYAQTQIWERDPTDATRKTVKRSYKATDPNGAKDPLATRLQRVYGVYTDAELKGTNYYNNPAPEVASHPGWINGFRVAPVTVGSSTAVLTRPGESVSYAGEIESVVGLYASMPSSYNDAKSLDSAGGNWYDPDHHSVQYSQPTMMVKPAIPDKIKAVRGIFDNADLIGTNYYDAALASPGYQTGEIYIRPTQALPPMATAFVQYDNLNVVEDGTDDTTEVAEWPVVATEVVVPDRYPIKQVRGVYVNATAGDDSAGTNYYVPKLASTIYQHGDARIILTDEMPGTTTSAEIHYEDMGVGFGPTADRIALKKPWNVMGPLYVAYYTGGTPTFSYNAKSQPTQATLKLASPLPAGVDKVYVRVSGDTFNCGDQSVRLMEDLYSTDDGAEAIGSLAVKPTDSTLIGGVIGVYTSKAVAESGDILSDSRADNLYAGKENPFKVGDTVIHLKSTLSAPPSVGDKLYVVYVPKNAYIKYSDVRYTHMFRGLSQQDSGSYYYTSGTKHFTPDGWSATILDRNDSPHLNVFIRSNLGDPAGGTDRLSDAVSSGVVGVWDIHKDVNFFDPKKSNRYSIDPLHLRLTTETPQGTNYLWARCYQRGEYHIDRWNREVTFLPGYERVGRVQASYFFGTKMPQTIGANTAPMLVAGSGKVTPLYGSRVTKFVYKVTYRDVDGPNGQAPSYVRVYVDGKAYDMTPVVQGTPAYSEGAEYVCTLPDGLTGADHKYHFEASDGAAVAWYDYNGSHQSLVGSITSSIVDIQGPWVNDPPSLSQGVANPNPTTGGINPWDSVDYFVVYSDADNDKPYTYDPVVDLNKSDTNKNGILDVIEFSGSPRLWVDSGAVDQQYSGTVLSLEGDPMDAGKKRTIVADGSPGWTSDQFAGKLMQIINGSLTGRVYLIQSNTSNKLTIATNDLYTDGIVTGGESNIGASRFVINGLLMKKEDDSQQNFAAGVRYKITVPKLALGNHKFHFTARSREDKPQWLQKQLTTEEEKVPFSTLVRFPQGTDATGPQVISTPPSGNVAPVITNSLVTSLYVGPRSQTATPVSDVEVKLDNATLRSLTREVRGVFLNASDFKLTELTSDEEKANNYYDPTDATTAYKQGDETIKLAKTLPSGVPATMVRFGDVTGDTLLEVKPDNTSLIAGIRGVYLTTDTDLATDYYTSSGSYDGAKIKLGKALPPGTKQVFVDFNTAADKTWGDVPVYVKYFSEKTSTVFKATDLVTFRINYRDNDGDSPNYHDNVQGYVKIVFDDLNLSYQMRPVNPPDVNQVIDYKNDVAFTSEPVTLPEGIHKYHFEASDGYYTPATAASCRWPQGVLGDPMSNDYSVQVNYKPVIVEASVDPPTGQPATEFTFTAKYRDPDGVVNAQKPLPRVTMRVSRVDGTGSEIFKELTGTGTSYSSGVKYSTTIVPRDVVPPLASGIYKVLFEATDQDLEEATPYPTASQAAITFTVREPGTNHAPVIDSVAVINKTNGKASGKLNDYFNYRAKYRDQDGDAPLSDDGKTRDVLSLTIDPGPNQIKLTLVKASTEPASPTPEQYKAGIYYELSDPISGRRLGGGQHTFVVNASDGISPATAKEGQGPLLLIPYFSSFKVVSAKEADPATAAAVTDAVVGDKVLIVGNLSFPVSNDPDIVAPSAVDNIAIQVRKPDGTVLTLEASATPKNWTGPLTVYYAKAQAVDPAFATGDGLTLTASGSWVVSASWPGNTTWDKASTEDRDATVSVGGPMRTVAVSDPTDPAGSMPLVDMITPPRLIGSGDPGVIFGYERALDMRIIRWDPSVGAYFKYGSQGQFPSLNPGDAVWIKPKVSYPADPITQTAVETTGLLALGNPEVAPDYSKEYRLIQTFVKDYTKNTTTGKLDPCQIQLRTGWNQFGNIFVNWKKDASGNVITPRKDIGIPISEVKVKYLNETKTLAAAAAAGWIRSYAWAYDAPGHRYVQVSESAAGAERVLLGWRGYWIRAFVDCVLIIDPNTSYNGLSTLSVEKANPALAQEDQLDSPPPIPE